MSHHLPTAALLLPGALLICSGIAARGQNGTPGQPPPPDSVNPTSAARTSLYPPKSDRHRPRPPYFLVFDVEHHIFYYRFGPNAPELVVPANFSVRPHDIVYFRAKNFDASKTVVKVTYQPIAPTLTALPTQLTAALPTLPTNSQSAPSGTSSSDTYAADDTRPGSRLQAALADAFHAYDANPNANQKEINTKLEAVRNRARGNMRIYFRQRNPDANDHVFDLDVPRFIFEEAKREIQQPNDANTGQSQLQRERQGTALDQYRAVADTYANIMKGTIFQVAEGPEEASDNVGTMVWRVEVSGKSETQLQPGTQPITTAFSLSVPKKDPRNVDFAVSAGAFGSFLRDGSYYVDKNNTIQAKTADKFSISTGVLVHLLFGPNNWPVRGGLSFGVTAESNPKWLAGFSAIAGHDQRIVFTLGIIGGKVQRLESGYTEGVSAPADKGTIPTESVNRTAFFFGIGFKF